MIASSYRVTGGAEDPDSHSDEGRFKLEKTPRYGMIHEIDADSGPYLKRFFGVGDLTTVPHGGPEDRAEMTIHLTLKTARHVHTCSQLVIIRSKCVNHLLPNRNHRRNTRSFPLVGDGAPKYPAGLGEPKYHRLSRVSFSQRKSVDWSPDRFQMRNTHSSFGTQILSEIKRRPQVRWGRFGGPPPPRTLTRQMVKAYRRACWYASSFL